MIAPWWATWGLDCRAMDLDLRLVRYAVVLARELHFGHAAAALNITQQTLSSQIAALEQRLGAPLFERDRRRVELTPAGHVFVDGGARLLAEAADLAAATINTPRPIRVDVITEGLVSGVLAAELRKRLTDQEFEIVQGHGLTAALPALVAGEIDFALGNVRELVGDLPVQLRHMPVCWQQLGLLVPSGHPLAELDEVSMAELAHYPLLVHTATEAPEWLRWNEVLVERFGLTVGHRLRGHGRGAVGAAVDAYAEPAIAPLDVTVPTGAVMRPVVDPVPVAEFSVVWRTAAEAAPRIVRVLEEVVSIVADRGWMRVPDRAWWMPDASGGAAAP